MLATPIIHPHPRLATGWHASVVTLSPICRYEFGGSSSAGLEFAPIGLDNMLNGGGAVQAVHAERVEAPGNTCASIMGAPGRALGCPPALDYVGQPRLLCGHRLHSNPGCCPHG